MMIVKPLSCESRRAAKGSRPQPLGVRSSRLIPPSRRNAVSSSRSTSSSAACSIPPRPSLAHIRKKRCSWGRVKPSLSTSTTPVTACARPNPISSDLHTRSPSSDGGWRVYDGGNLHQHNLDPASLQLIQRGGRDVHIGDHEVYVLDWSDGKQGSRPELR